MPLTEAATSTGNPGEPRDLQFYGPFLDMFFDQSATEWRDLRFHFGPSRARKRAV